jgi:hypothetical protein
MTMYEPNPEVRETGAEVDEFVDAPQPGPTAPPPTPPDRAADLSNAPAVESER